MARKKRLRRQLTASTLLSRLCKRQDQAKSTLIPFVGASGDAKFLASLKAVKNLKKVMPDIHIEVGMVGEFVLGLHGGLKYDHIHLADLYFHKKFELVEKASVDVFEPFINTKSNISVSWNIALACIFFKACLEVSKILSTSMQVWLLGEYRPQELLRLTQFRGPLSP